MGGGSLFHIRCCAPIVNLIVQALNTLASILHCIRNMVMCIDRCLARRKKFFFDVAKKNFKL